MHTVTSDGEGNSNGSNDCDRSGGKKAKGRGRTVTVARTPTRKPEQISDHVKKRKRQAKKNW